MIWHVLTGEYPPACGGVGDYTAEVAAALAAAGDTVHVWVAPHLSRPSPGGRDRPGVIVHALPDRFGRASRRELAAAWRVTPGTILLQYVPNALGARGANLAFCLWLRKIHKAGADVRVMFHEPYFYFSLARPWRNVLAIVQRTMAATLLQAAGTIYLSTETWYRYLRAVGVLPPVETLPIPSSLPSTPSQASIDHYRREMTPDAALLVGHFGTYGDHVAGELTALLPTLAARLPTIRFALAGAGSREFLGRLREQHPELAGRAWASGRLDGDAVSAVLRGCQVLIQPYPDGITTRRTSVMAGLKNGIATVSTLGFLTEPIWTQSGAVALAPTGDVAGFADAVARLLQDPAGRAALGDRGAQTYRDRFSIEHTVAALRAAPAGAA
jgi:glycosyltransferase involved in cell wall biosynthesis